MKIFRSYLIVIIIWVSFVFLFFACLNIPKNGRWWNDFNISYEEMVKEGSYPAILRLGEQKWDNYTAAYFMNFLYHFDNNHPIYSGTRLEFAVAAEPREEDFVYNNLGALLAGDEVRIDNYSRYWAGFSIVLYPFLFIMSVNCLRLLMFYAGLILSMIVIYRYLKRGEYSVCMAFGLAIIMAHWLFNCMCVIYGTDILLSLIVINLWMLLKDRVSPVVFMVLFGGLTMFFCMLSTPMIVLGMWLVIYVYEDKSPTVIIRLTNTLKVSIGWAVGYAVMMEAKGLLAKALGLESTANSRAAELFGKASIAERLRISVRIAIDFLLPWFWIWIPILLVVAVMIIKRKYDNTELKKRLPVLFVALYPFVWEIVFYAHTNHGIEKNLYVITAFAVLLFLFAPMDNGLKHAGKCNT